MTMACTLTTTPIADTICSGEASCFMHGPTFMGNPLAAAVADASLRLLLESDWQKRITQIEAQLKAELAPAEQLESVEEVRVLGAIGVIEMKKTVNMAILQREFVDAGIWVRPFARLVYLMPPYIITNEELSYLTQKLLYVLNK